MIEIGPLIINNNKETIRPISQCHSSHNKRSTELATILEDTEYISTGADSAATGHFFPNKDKNRITTLKYK